MGTRSNIFVKLNDTEFGKIYCHWDGYPTHHGKILQKFYKTHSKCKSLLKLGNISSLRRKLRPVKGITHTYENPQEDVVVAYGRDRGETEQAMQIIAAKTPDEVRHAMKIAGENWDIEFFYVFDGSEWFVFGDPNNCEVLKVSDVLKMEDPNSFGYKIEE